MKVRGEWKMTAERVGDMTVQELRQLIRQEVDQHLGIRELLERPKDTRSVQEILESIDRHRWTPPPGSKSTGELLREDRDR
jgi:hypothetical protein